MNHWIPSRLSWVPIFTALLAFSGCKVETDAEGVVHDSVTGAPVPNAHVMQIAVMNKATEFLCETFTDSLGHFYMDAGQVSLGNKKHTLYVIVESDSFWTGTFVNNHTLINARIRHQ